VLGHTLTCPFLLYVYRINTEYKSRDDEKQASPIYIFAPGILGRPEGGDWDFDVDLMVSVR
jgi:hypothetical protein